MLDQGEIESSSTLNASAIRVWSLLCTSTSSQNTNRSDATSATTTPRSVATSPSTAHFMAGSVADARGRCTGSFGQRTEHVRGELRGQRFVVWTTVAPE